VAVMDRAKKHGNARPTALPANSSTPAIVTSAPSLQHALARGRR
jgi:hypothetical protein